MKILMLIDSLDIGGAETHVETLARELSSMGHEITVACAGGQLIKNLKCSKIRYIPLPRFLKGERKGSDLHFTLRFLPLKVAISRAIEQSNPDLVHAHTRKTAFLAHSICQRRKIPLAVTVHALFSMKFPKNILSKWGDATIAVSEDIKNHLLKLKNTKLKIEIIPNGVEIPPCSRFNPQK